MTRTCKHCGTPLFKTIKMPIYDCPKCKRFYTEDFLDMLDRQELLNSLGEKDD